MSRTSIYDVAIIGGGIVGMATAMAMAEGGKGSIVVLEAENSLAAHQTGNNSGVIHSGLYYKPGSLKAKNCTYGRELLYEFCKKNKIPHERCGKVVVAVDERELPYMEKLMERGIQNGLKGIKKLNAEELKEYEPHVDGIAGLFIPQTGIVDFKAVTEKFGEKFLKAGGEIRLNYKVKWINAKTDGIILDNKKEKIYCKNLVNCAGLQSDRIAKMAGVNPGLKIIGFRGEYYNLKTEAERLVNHLIYPLPDPRFPFLGVHFTRMIKGGVEAGPNAVLAFKRDGYKKTSFSIRDFLDIIFYSGFWIMGLKNWKMGFGEMYRSWNKGAFVRALQRMVPGLKNSDLVPGGAGVRAQALEPNGFLVDDFRLIEKDNMVHVLNAPSPAATASISIGKTIAKIAAKNFQLEYRGKTK
jgi:L-2-hydroxyglutarate oxidase